MSEDDSFSGFTLELECARHPFVDFAVVLKEGAVQPFAGAEYVSTLRGTHGPNYLAFAVVNGTMGDRSPPDSEFHVTSHAHFCRDPATGVCLHFRVKYS